MAKIVGRARTRRTNRRLAKIRLAHPKALHHIEADGRYTPREVRQVRRRARQLKSADHQSKRAGYNPLAPLTGKALRKESRAAAKLQYGPQQAELAKQLRGQSQTAANTAQYYDDYKKALADATSRINARNDAGVQAAQGRVDSVYAQDKAAVAARDKAASERAAKLGRGPVQSQEGAQAVEAARSQGNQSVGALRTNAAADTKFMELRGANSVLAKAEALEREGKRRDDLLREKRNLKKERAAFRVDFRNKAREDERTYALARKEFGLKKKDLKLQYKQSAADRKLERQKTNAQKIIARMYSSADRAGARAQIRVAQLNLKKGRITKHQFNTIRNIYEGLGNGGGSKKKGKGSGAGGSLAPWEKDRISDAVYSLKKHNAAVTDRASWMQKMQEAGVPARLARIAWQRYAKEARKRSQRPDTAGNPNVAR